MHVDADGSRPSSFEESMRQSEPHLHERREPSYGEHMAGLTPKWGYPMRVPMRCDARVHNALVSADERLGAARSERAGWVTVCACVPCDRAQRLMDHEALVSAARVCTRKRYGAKRRAGGRTSGAVP